MEDRPNFCPSVSTAILTVLWPAEPRGARWVARDGSGRAAPQSGRPRQVAGARAHSLGPLPLLSPHYLPSLSLSLACCSDQASSRHWTRCCGLGLGASTCSSLSGLRPLLGTGRVSLSPCLLATATCNSGQISALLSSSRRIRGDVQRESRIQLNCCHEL